jgi:hypothetical protein
LKSLHLILSPSKDGPSKNEAKGSYFFSGLQAKSIKAGLDPAIRLQLGSRVPVPCALLVENAYALHVRRIRFFVRVSDRQHAELAELR